ncbi:uncharacterized protein LOC126898692 [Daktulosphaira vitifoliae]|uniref:uncharacterized protein LOC126898692 n=1 Tax=Daktulosphaira vitifoliae TaxID=58002 RepID=UPI0021AA8953|nr:uncharacterized protein LOC126898692 [Daktulosphaira vitifoliae]
MFADEVSQSPINDVAHLYEYTTNPLQKCSTNNIFFDQAITLAKVSGDLVRQEKSHQDCSHSCQQNEQCDNDLVFKSAERVWGKEFNSSIAKTVCEACVYTKGSSVDCIRYTKRGTAMCAKACERQNKNILRVSPTIVLLKDAYCTKKVLKAAACVCVFKVICQAYKHYVFIHFIPNKNGDVAMQYFETGHPLKVPL